MPLQAVSGVLLSKQQTEDTGCRIRNKELQNCCLKGFMPRENQMYRRELEISKADIQYEVKSMIDVWQKRDRREGKGEAQSVPCYACGWADISQSTREGKHDTQPKQATSSFNSNERC